MTPAKPSPAIPQAVDNCHALILWMIPQLDKLPRKRRFTLGDRIENNLLIVLEQVTAAAYKHRCREHLQEANQKLALIRHLWRVAWELQSIAPKSYQHGAKLMVHLGRQIGAWVKVSPA